MRLNIYEEEMTNDIEWVRKDDVIGEDGNLVTFHGLRVFLKSPDELHHNEIDDDRSAITFWSREPVKLRKFAILLAEA